MPADYHMGCAIAAYLLDNDDHAVRRHLSIYAAIRGISPERAEAQMHVQIAGANTVRVPEFVA